MVAAGIAVAGRTAEKVLDYIEALGCTEAAVGMNCSLAETRRIQIADSLTCCLEGLEEERTTAVSAGTLCYQNVAHSRRSILR